MQKRIWRSEIFQYLSAVNRRFGWNREMRHFFWNMKQIWLWDCIFGSHRLLSPKDDHRYQRLAFAYPAGDVRITFDTDIRGALYPYGLFEEVGTDALGSTEQVLMEVNIQDSCRIWSLRHWKKRMNCPPATANIPEPEWCDCKFYIRQTGGW